MPVDSKVCPFCAETIKAAAIICRFCGRDQVANTVSPPARQASRFIADDAVVARELILLLDAPYSGEEISHLAEGQPARVRASEGGWVEIETESGRRGWAEAVHFDLSASQPFQGAGSTEAVPLSSATVALSTSSGAASYGRSTVNPKAYRAGRGGPVAGIAIVAIVGIVGLLNYSSPSGSAGLLNSFVAALPTQVPIPTRVPTPTLAPPSKAVAFSLDPRQLAAAPSTYVGRNIWLQGEALTVTQNDTYTWVQLMAGVPGRPYTTESVVIEFRPKQTSILRAECYKMYGIANGTQTVTRALTGAQNEVPVVQGYAVEHVVTGGTYQSCSMP